MRYEGNIYRPPSEARSYLLQVTIGCAHNKCTFCSMFKDKKFRVRDMDEVMEDLRMARQAYRRVDKMFLCDGDALCLSNDKLLTILEKIEEDFPECERLGVYGSPQDVLRKTLDELKELKKAGLQIIYIGAESGSDKVLKDICKGATRAEIIEAVKKIEAAGIAASVTFISGLGGRPDWEEHARESGTMISEMEPSYVGLLTLMLEPGAELRDDVQSGKFQLLSAEEVVAETLLMLKNIDVKKKCVFRSNHASNYVSLRGDLPADKEMMIGQLRRAMENTNLLKDERFRML
ncbi:MAG: radical SAM protein [Eubacteriaceae bacterium]|nr:radical SAM protein [Eubacteriaceae bacterium]